MKHWLTTPEISLRKRLTPTLDTLRRKNLKRVFSVWKHIKCFPFTLHQRNLKTVFSLWERIGKCVSSAPFGRNVTTVSPTTTKLAANWGHNIKEFKKGNNHRSFWIKFVFEENSGREITCHRFRKVSFSKCFPSTRGKRKAGGLKSVLVKLLFRDGLVWTVVLTVEIKLRFGISSG